MKICLHRGLLGSDKHLVFCNDEFFWCTSIPDDAWVYGSTDDTRELSCIIDAVGYEIDPWPSSSHMSAWACLRGKMGTHVQWTDVLSPSMLKRYTQRTLDHLQRLLVQYHDTYYMREFLSIREFLGQLNRSHIDANMLRRIIESESNQSNTHVLRTFMPEEDGMTKRIRYNQSGSVTGRLTVESGPSILTLKKEHRKILKSRYSDGSIVEIDFSSLEPRILLSNFNKETEDDIYKMISRDLFNESLSRSIVKIVTLSTLYGSSHKRVSSMIEDKTIDVHLAQKKIREYFSIPSLSRRLSREFSENGYINSVFGRKIVPRKNSNHIFINHFIQSTATDFSILGFKGLCNKLDTHKIRSSPLFVIHDALVLDIHNNDIDKVKKIISSGITLENFYGTFPISFKTIS